MLHMCVCIVSSPSACEMHDSGVSIGVRTSEIELWPQVRSNLAREHLYANGRGMRGFLSTVVVQSTAVALLQLSV